MKKFIKEFKDFALNGSMIDLTVGIILAGAFSKIINSFVTDFFMPLISIVSGNMNFSQLIWTFSIIGTSGKVIVSYGLLINATINFLIIAIGIFIIIKIINPFKRKQQKINNNKIKEEIIILKEIRDLLKRNINDNI